QVVRMVTEGEIISMSGKRVKRRVDSLCVHGDEPTAVALAAKVREGLEAAGVKILPLTEMKLD
ncbi:MAG TPA: LamB/YcsF family protein, partial [Pusillimonas sp.]|nr:LamB/YcsF family protein [Pusillimonas sp.]